MEETANGYMLQILPPLTRQQLQSDIRVNMGVEREYRSTLINTFGNPDRPSFALLPRICTFQFDQATRMTRITMPALGDRPESYGIYSLRTIVDRVIMCRWYPSPSRVYPPWLDQRQVHPCASLLDGYGESLSILYMIMLALDITMTHPTHKSDFVNTAIEVALGIHPKIRLLPEEGQLAFTAIEQLINTTAETDNRILINRATVVFEDSAIVNMHFMPSLLEVLARARFEAVLQVTSISNAVLADREFRMTQVYGKQITQILMQMYNARMVTSEQVKQALAQRTTQLLTGTGMTYEQFLIRENGSPVPPLWREGAYRTLQEDADLARPVLERAQTVGDVTVRDLNKAQMLMMRLATITPQGAEARRAQLAAVAMDEYQAWRAAYEAHRRQGKGDTFIYKQYDDSFPNFPVPPRAPEPEPEPKVHYIYVERGEHINVERRPRRDQPHKPPPPPAPPRAESFPPPPRAGVPPSWFESPRAEAPPPRAEAPPRPEAPRAEAPRAEARAEASPPQSPPHSARPVVQVRDRNSSLEILRRNYGIVDKKTYRTWAAKNHPDKGGDSKRFQYVSGLVAVVNDTGGWPELSFRMKSCQR